MFLLLQYLHFAAKTAHQKHLTREDTAMVNECEKRLHIVNHQGTPNEDTETLNTTSKI